MKKQLKFFYEMYKPLILAGLGYVLYAQLFRYDPAAIWWIGFFCGLLAHGLLDLTWRVYND